jgi:hypothetical protein
LEWYLTEPNYTHVTLVVDPEFGERAKAQAKIGPLWVINSPRNVAAIEALWAAGSSPFRNAPTCFDAKPQTTAEDSAVDLIGTLDEHHPSWRTFEIIGAKLSPRLLQVLRECTPGTAEETAAGFIFTRRTN